MRLPAPMLARAGRLPAGRGYAFEVKFDGFRCLLGSDGRVRCRSRRGWNMTRLLPELHEWTLEGIFDGELVALVDGRPCFDALCARLLHGDTSVRVSYVVFDLLELEGESLLNATYARRREALEQAELGEGPWLVADSFDDGAALWAAVCEHGLEGVVAKKLNGLYRPGERRWIKAKNPCWPRYEREREAGRTDRHRAALPQTRR